MTNKNTKNSQFKLVVDFFKPRIVFMQVVTVFMGYLVAAGQFPSFEVSMYLMWGTICTASGAAALNNSFEINLDAKMNRTQNRILPTHNLSLKMGFNLGLLLTALGTYLCLKINLWVAFVGLLTVFSYVLIYTPLKRKTWLNTFVGGVPGALPPVAGWLATGQSLDGVAISLFALLFCWQIPHFFSIAWLYLDDYKKAGFCMLPPIDTVKRTLNLTIIYTILTISISFYPYLTKNLGVIYLGVASLAGILFLKNAMLFKSKADDTHAKKVLISSVIYLPVLCLAILVDTLVL